MGLATGLNALRDQMTKATADYSNDKAQWLKMSAGETLEIRFLQEVDADSKFYSEKNGLVLAASEHSHPKDYRKKAVCTMAEDGKCYGCEQNAIDPKAGWRARTRLYANVLVGDPKSKDAYVAVISQGFSGRSITPNLLQTAEAFGGVTRTIFKITRMGSGTDTSYSLFPFGNDEAFDPESYDLYDLAKVAVRMVPYEEQAHFYNPSADGEEAASSEEESNIW
jgi:hypothetical protein